MERHVADGLIHGLPEVRPREEPFEIGGAGASAHVDGDGAETILRLSRNRGSRSRNADVRPPSADRGALGSRASSPPRPRARGTRSCTSSRALYARRSAPRARARRTARVLGVRAHVPTGGARRRDDGAGGDARGVPRVRGRGVPRRGGRAGRASSWGGCCGGSTDPSATQVGPTCDATEHHLLR